MAAITAKVKGISGRKIFYLLVFPRNGECGVLWRCCSIFRATWCFFEAETI